MINNSNNILYQDSIPFFTTIMDLRAFQDYDQGSIVEVGGRVSIGDGYGSKFIYDSTSTQADDNEYVVRPDNIAANGSGRWLINGWAFLDDKMNANNKYLTGMTISSSQITNSTIDNTTIKGSVSVDPTTDWSKNTVVGALDIDNRYETKDHANTSLSDLSQNLTTTLENYTDTSVNNMGALKANLAGGNTLTGNQIINGGLTVANSGGTIYGNTTGSSKWYISRNDGQKCTIINSYNGSWKYLSIEDDGTIQCNNGTLALQSAVDAKANLSGGNALVGDQSISSGSLEVLASDSSYTGILKQAEATEKGAIVRYNDGTTNHDWVLGTDSITSPNGEIISTSGNYAVKNEDNNFTATQTIDSASLNIDNGSLIFTNPSGDNVTIYTDIEGAGVSKNDLVFRTNTGTNSLYTSISNTGDIISSTYGNVAFENRPNNFTQNMTIKSPGNGANPLVMSSDTGRQAFEFGFTDDDTTPGSFIDFHAQPVGGSYQDFDVRMMVYNSSSGVPAQGTLDIEGAGFTWNGSTVARVHSDFDYGPINGGYYTRVGNIITQYFTATGTGDSTINFPITFSAIPIVQLTINRQHDAVSRYPSIDNTGDNNIPNVTTSGFTFQPVYTGSQTGTSGTPFTLQVTVTGQF